MERPALDRVALLHPQCNLGNFIEATRTVSPSKVAIVDTSGPKEVVLSYAALEDQIRRATGVFRGVGVTSRTRVAIGLPNSALFLISFLAAMRLGGIPVFLNPRLAIDTVRFIVEDLGAEVILADLDDVPALASLADLPRLRVCLATQASPANPWQSWPSRFAGAEPDATVLSMCFDDQAFQPYTAGSTGTPKGIVLTHGGMLWGIEHSDMYWSRRPDERGIVAAPMFHKNAMRGTIKPMLRAGCSVVIMRAFRPREYLETLSRYKVTICGGVPAMFADILREEDLIARGDYSALEVLSMGSATVPQELSARLARAFPGTTVKESYGLTEGGGPTRAHPAGIPTPAGSVGVIAPEYEAKLVDAAGNPNAQMGELHIRSPYILKEYAGRPDLTAERLYDGWLRTGDLFRMDGNGFLFFLGRTDDMFSCGGENIYPKDVENLVLRHADVSDVIVVPLPHRTKSFAPAALVLPRPGRSVEPADIQDFCAQNGPAFAIPRAVLVVDDLPRTTAGKSDRGAALEILYAVWHAVERRPPKEGIVTITTIADTRLLEWTQRFVRYPSEQTDLMEQDPAVRSFVSDCVRPLLEELGLSPSIDAFGNLICDVGPAGSGMEVLLVGYAMTHPRNRMDGAFEGQVLNGSDGPILRGRGVSEQKSALAAALAAFVDVASAGRLKKRVGFAVLTAGETGRHDAIAAALQALGTRPRFGILAIGTGTKIALGNRGRLDVEVRIVGKSSHSSTPWAGVDVTKGVRQLLDRLDELGRDLPEHPVLGPTTLTCTSIKTSPDATHTVQSEALMVFDRRLMPGEDPEQVLQALQVAFALEPPLLSEVKRGPFMYGSIVERDGPLVTEVESALRAEGLRVPQTFFSPGALDAGYLIENGTEAIKWGPGDPSQFHTDDERVSLADIVLMAKSYRSVLNRLVA